MYFLLLAEYILLSLFFNSHDLNFTLFSFLAQYIAFLPGMLNLKHILSLLGLLLKSMETGLICYSVWFPLLVKFSDLLIELISLGLEGTQILSYPRP